MTAIQGFWSYVHADDQAEGSRIRELARDIISQYELITGEKLEIFLDIDKLEWGDQWRQKIDEALTSGAFFIPVLTPRYFQSGECRRELRNFMQSAKTLGVRDLVMPILYVDVPALNQNPCPDELVELTRSFQWQDWRDLRFSATASAEYRRAVAALASRLSAAVESAERVDVSTTVEQIVGDDESDEPPGFIDIAAQSEETFPEWSNTITRIGKELENVTEIIAKASSELTASDARGGGASARLSIFRDLAHQLEGPVATIHELSNLSASQLIDIDPGVRALIELIPQEVEERPESIEAAESFLSSIEYLISQGRAGFEGAEELAANIEPAEGGSRNLRPVLRKLRKSLTLLAEGRDTLNEWEGQIQRLDLSSMGR